MPKREVMDNFPSGPPARRQPEMVRQAWPITITTPLFGGGVDVRQADEKHPIRETAIRGHLRFWWRATRGRQCSDVSSLHQREEEIFGSTTFPSPLQVEVRNVRLNSRNPFVTPHEFRRSEPEGYALFALQPGDRLFREGLSFELHLSWCTTAQLSERRAAQNKSRIAAALLPFPADVADITEDITAAVRAWVNFGGLGGRTRRGCGSLWCPKEAPETVGSVGHWFNEHFRNHRGQSPGHADWPKLSGTMYHHTQPEPPVTAWLRGLTILREFRQGRTVGRDPGRGNRPGRSRFPEPETIRRVLGQGTHPRQEDIPANAFPRAELGLPIVFHFKDDEVEESILYPRNGADRANRMASPLVIKPWCLSETQAVAVIVPLQTPPLTSVELTVGGRDNVVGAAWPVTAIRDPRLAAYPASPLGPIPSAQDPRVSKGSPAGSAVEAFLTFAASADNGFRRV